MFRNLWYSSLKYAHSSRICTFSSILVMIGWAIHFFYHICNIWNILVTIGWLFSFHIWNILVTIGWLSHFIYAIYETFLSQLDDFSHIINHIDNYHNRTILWLSDNPNVYWCPNVKTWYTYDPDMGYCKHGKPCIHSHLR